MWFDFHHECRKMKWNNISKLVDLIKEQLDTFDHFQAKLDCGFDYRENINAKTCLITNTQKGVIRTSCMDCLDRTNVVQSVFSRKIAHKQMWNIGI